MFIQNNIVLLFTANIKFPLWIPYGHNCTDKCNETVLYFEELVPFEIFETDYNTYSTDTGSTGIDFTGTDYTDSVENCVIAFGKDLKYSATDCNEKKAQYLCQIKKNPSK